MMVDESHPKYQEYWRKCQELLQKQKGEANAIEKEGELHDIYRKYAKKLRALQQEYAFLFTEAETEDSGK